jgi:MoxR-like ATPase
MHTQINGRTITLTQPARPIRALLAGRAWQTDEQPADGPADLAQVSNDLQALWGELEAKFIDRSELIEAALTALVAGEHTFVYGPPGTAKTAVIETLAAGIGGTFAERQITAETTTDEVFGPIDAVAFSQGQYTRRWAGIAVADVFYINEVWEASSTVTNIFKTALESRKVHDGDVERAIPLLSAIADSNHVPTDKNQQADWDRFLVRLAVGYIRDAGLFDLMLTADAGGTRPFYPDLTPDHLRLTAAAAELMALNPPADLKEVLVSLWRELGQNGRSVSDRRWRKTLKLACAAALLEGVDPEPRHLAVGRWTLWNELDEREEVANLVMSQTDPLAGEVLDAEALLADLKKARDSIARGDMMARQEVISRGRKLSKQAQELIDRGANGYTGRLQTVIEQADQVWEEVLDWKV